MISELGSDFLGLDPHPFGNGKNLASVVQRHEPPLVATGQGVAVFLKRLLKGGLAVTDCPAILKNPFDRLGVFSNPLGLLSGSLTFQEEAEALMSLTSNPDEAPVYVDDPQFWTNVEWPVGLDSVYRFTPGPYGIPMGLKGWWESEETFVIHCDYIGNIGREQIRFTFEGDQVTFQIWVEDHGLLAEFSGKLEK